MGLRRTTDSPNDMEADEFYLETVHKLLDDLSEYPLQFQQRGRSIWQFMFRPCEPTNRDLPTGSAWYVCTIWFHSGEVEVFDEDMRENRRIKFDFSALLAAVRHFVEQKKGVLLTEGVGIPTEEQI